MIAKRRRKNGRAGRLYIGAIATVFMIAMFAQIVKVYQKDQEYIEREAKLEEELLQETIRQQELYADEPVCGGCGKEQIGSCLWQ